ncbi:MAG: TIGR03619 family F420-dependent LLM class oxidoreductase [Novosphingobium sp.]|nr:TIGR03619 family F420-dependent LLM class oxidoreductase [Novosphingobium sp.]
MKLTFPLPHLMEIKAMMQPWELTVTGPDQLRLAQAAEDLGYDMIGVPEHLAMPPDQFEHSGRFWFHATTAQAAIAGATKRIRINSSVTILPLQHPIAHAKALATADWMSGGRINVTFGLGSMEKEYEYFDVPFSERGAMADEYLEAIVALWTQDTPSYNGKYVRFENVGFDPKPVQKPHLPIWIGGDSNPALRRAARFGAGWIISYRTRPEDIPARIDYIKSQPTWVERPFDVMFGLGTTRLTTGHAPRDDPKARPGMSAQEIIDQLSWYREMGVTCSSVPIPPVADTDAYLDYAQWVMEEIRPRL